MLRRLGIAALMALAAAPSVSPTAALASAPTITKLHRSASLFFISIVAGPDGNLWFTASERGSFRGVVGRITPRGKVTEFHRGITGRMYAEEAPIAVGPDGNLWFAESSRGGAPYPAGIVGRITPAGRVTELRHGITAPVKTIAAGPDGNLWFTEAGSSRSGPVGGVGRITPAGTVQTVVSDTQGEGPEYHGLIVNTVFDGGIAAGPEGDLWVTGDGGIARVTPAGAVAAVPLPNPSLCSEHILTGPDGDLWCTGADTTGPSIERVAVSTGAGAPRLLGARRFPIGAPEGYLHAIAVGPDGNVWFAAQNERGFARVGWVTPGGHVTRLPQRLGSPNGSFLDGIAAGPDGNVWLTDNGRTSPSSIDRVNLPGRAGAAVR